MKLYYKPGACSLASHIVLHELAQPFDIEKVDTTTKRTESGDDYLEINPKGYVPALTLDSNDTITEGPAILQYLADSNAESDLIPAIGNISRSKVLEHLTYVSSELHKAFAPLFKADTTDEGKQAAKENVAKKFDYLEGLLANGRKYLVDNNFSIADAYLFVVSNWANFVGIELSSWKNLSIYVARIAQRNSTQRAMKVEGLIG